MAPSLGTPAVRAAYMKNLFAQLASHRLDPASRLDADLQREVEAASRASWLPVALNVRTVEAVTGAVGEEPGLALLAECVHAQFESALWRGFIGPAVQLLGASPEALGGWIPRAMQIVFRDCGSWSVEQPHEGELTLRVHDLPPELADHRLWLRSLGVGMGSLFRVCDTEGAADLAGHDADARTAVFELSWKIAPW